MDGDFAAGIVRSGDAGAELGLRKGRPRRFTLAPMIVGVEFDERRD